MDTNAEMMVLSAMFLDETAAANVSELIGRDVAAFTDDRRQALYGVMLDMLDARLPFDGTVMSSEIKRRGLEATLPNSYLLEVAEAAPSHHMAEYHAAIIIEAATRRRLISALNTSLNEVYSVTQQINDITDRIESRVFSVTENKVGSRQVRTLASHLEEMTMRGAPKEGIKTGYYELDNMTLGLHGGEMIVLAARPNVGKTAIALNIAEYVTTRQNVPTLFFSLEMRVDRLMERLLSLRSGVEIHAIRRNILTPDNMRALGSAVADLREAPLYFDDVSSLNLFELRARSRRMKSKYGIRFIVLDYLQLMDANDKAENRQQEITRISRGIKTLANELDVPILCLSQLNRASETEQRRPRSSDLRESGAIEQDADAVLLLHRQDVLKRGEEGYQEDNRAQLILSKQRNGPCGTVELAVNPRTTRFDSYAHGV